MPASSRRARKKPAAPAPQDVTFARKLLIYLSGLAPMDESGFVAIDLRSLAKTTFHSVRDIKATLNGLVAVGSIEWAQRKLTPTHIRYVTAMPTTFGRAIKKPGKSTRSKKRKAEAPSIMPPDPLAHAKAVTQALSMIPHDERGIILVNRASLAWVSNLSQPATETALHLLAETGHITWENRDREVNRIRLHDLTLLAA